MLIDISAYRRAKHLHQRPYCPVHGSWLKSTGVRWANGHQVARIATCNHFGCGHCVELPLDEEAHLAPRPPVVG